MKERYLLRLSGHPCGASAPKKKIYRGLLVGTNEFKKRVKKIEQNFFVDKKK